MNNPNFLVAETTEVSAAERLAARQKAALSAVVATSAKIASADDYIDIEITVTGISKSSKLEPVSWTDPETGEVKLLEKVSIRGLTPDGDPFTGVIFEDSCDYRGNLNGKAIATFRKFTYKVKSKDGLHEAGEVSWSLYSVKDSLALAEEKKLAQKRELMRYQLEVAKELGIAINLVGA